jgi:hypothetical protein
MKLKEFERLVGAYGADVSRWPEAKRAAALGLLATSPDAHRARRAAMQLDQALDRVAPAIDPERSAQVRHAIFEHTAGFIAPGHARSGRLAALCAWPNVLVLSAMAVLGLFVGFTDLIGAPAASSSPQIDVFSFELGPLATLER